MYPSIRPNDCPMRLPADEAGGFPSQLYASRLRWTALVSALGSMCIAALPANRRNWSPICERLRALKELD
jgi:hypothetical protein